MTENEMMKGLLLVSHLDNCKETAQLQGQPMPPVEKALAKDKEIIRLPEPGMLDDVETSFLEMTELRSSIRQYSQKPLTVKELSFLLWCTQGVKGMTEMGTTLRNVPSAGGRHAFETYLYIRRVEGITPGIYRFLALGHALQLVTTDEAEIAKFIGAFKSRGVVENCAVIFLWTAVYERMVYRFGHRAVRYIFLDAGHVCQNLYLAAYVNKTATCALGAFFEEAINEVLGLDGVNEFPVYGAAVGKPDF